MRFKNHRLDDEFCAFIVMLKLNNDKYDIQDSGWLYSIYLPDKAYIDIYTDSSYDYFDSFCVTSANETIMNAFNESGENNEDKFYKIFKMLLQN